MNLSILILLQDFGRGTHIIKAYKFLKKTDFWTKEQLKNYKFEKFKRLITYSYEHVPYYTELFDSVGLKPTDIKTMGDISKIPISTKEMIRRYHNKLLPDNLNINSRKLKKGKTGGTTGMPLLLYKDAQTRDFTWGAFYRWYDWMGISTKDRIACLWGDASVLTKERNGMKQLLTKMFSKQLKISSFNLNDKTLPIVAEQLIRFRPVFLHGYLSAILQMAEYFKLNNLSLPTLKAISSTTETLLPPYREYIEKALGAPMYDQYGCGECNSIAFECNAHEGLHINEEHCIIEVLDDEDNHIDDQSGRIVLTDLDNYAMPFIRYENGDSAVMSSKLCSCGRKSVLLSSICGRTKDVVYLKDGSAVHGVFFTDLFHELGFDNFEYFTRFQIYQKEKGSFICRLEKTRKVLPDDKLQLIQLTLWRFGNDVDIEFYDKLPNDKSGKFRYVLSDVIN